MFRTVFIAFIKDRSLFSLFYFLGVGSVLLFFYISHPAQSEIMYPTLIACFLYILYLLIEWSKYGHFHRQLKKRHAGESRELAPKTEEQRVMTELIETVTSDFRRDMSQLHIQNKERLYLVSHWIHQLKTPVSVNELLMDQLLKEETNSQSVDLLKRMKRENRGLHSRIEQGLTMIRMEGFEHDFEPRPVHLLSSLRKVVNARKSEFIYHHILPVIEGMEGVRIITDEKWNEVLLEQIISNAVKYSRGQGEMKKIYLSGQADGEAWILTIRDEGVGIPPYDLERVFEPFFTGENGRKFRDSSGIGLYICGKIAKELGHTIAIQSQVGKGTEISIRYLTKL
ncbi:sensor histidine kinase [Halalkalibacterium halodurans]|uniref:sensor histidine kinase n=1 Tax=Halalkalibacterium halodurans TaxID=86665 RepID=UPI002AA968E0|nr:sensor histidine kinase [Halalkalibacterium halodurans]MDY7223232.1 sensor histidine kinase [Halalkalibacterium halodurans]MDY7242453.1 sensor histidine kinase [Halalkalibacterium halodurans]